MLALISKISVLECPQMFQNAATKTHSQENCARQENSMKNTIILCTKGLSLTYLLVIFPSYSSFPTSPNMFFSKQIHPSIKHGLAGNPRTCNGGLSGKNKLHMHGKFQRHDLKFPIEPIRTIQKPWIAMGDYCAFSNGSFLGKFIYAHYTAI